MTNKNKNIQKEEWRNREDQDLRKDVIRDEHIERTGRENDDDDARIVKNDKNGIKDL